MYELIQVSDRCYYINCPAKIGIVMQTDREVCLIDSGNNKDAGKRVKRILDANGWTLRAIYNTHSNADHIGGNKYLQAQTGCSIYAPGMECALTRHTVLEPAYLYGGCPPRALRHHFLLAEESDAQYLTREVLPPNMSILPLKGHFFDMVGFMTDDGIAYIADCLSGKETLDKYGIGVIYDVRAYLETLEQLKTMQAKLFIPSHAEPTDHIAPLAQYNIDKVYEIIGQILALCKEPITFEMLLKGLFDHYSLRLNLDQYVLVGSTVRSYLSYLMDEGRVEVLEADRLLYWKSIG